MTQFFQGTIKGTQRIEGATDSTLIGNTGDRLKVDAGTGPSLGANIRYDDMNATNGGVARGTLIGTASWTTIYSYSGTGLLVGWLAALENFDNEGFFIRLVVDGQQLYGTNGISTLDLTNKDIYLWEKKAFQDQVVPFFLGFSIAEKGLRWQAPVGLPVKFSSTISIQVKKIAGNSKAFQAGLVNIIKES